MATTTNYSWSTPDDTALVKDGAAAIRTLGSSIDTTTKALNPSTTLGDIEYRSSTANTNTRLGIGTTNQVLSVVGGVPAWATVSAGMVQLATGSLSTNETSITGISGSYKTLILLVEDFHTSGGSGAFMRLNNNTNNIYRSQYITTGGTSVTANSIETSARWSGGTPTASGTYSRFIAKIDFYALTTSRKTVTLDSYWGDSGSNTSNQGYFSFAETTPAAITSIQIRAGGAETWSAGTYTLYGAN
jgi:hypothetical protein